MGFSFVMERKMNEIFEKGEEIVKNFVESGGAIDFNGFYKRISIDEIKLLIRFFIYLSENGFIDMDTEDFRYDHCKCGNLLKWNCEMEKVQCPKCNTIYYVNSDSQLVYWLEEVLDKIVPYKTDVR
jgi:hypothetical protein